MKTDAILQPLLQSSHLPTLVAQLNRVVLEEEQKRRDFYEWLDEDKRAEFLLGELVIHSPARAVHITVLQNLEFLLLRHIREHKTGKLFREQAMVRMERSDVMPDLAFWSTVKAETIRPDTKLFPPPDFVVEALSPSTERYDREVKMKEYAANGVLEYWLVHPEEQYIEQYELHGETYRPLRTVRPGEALPCLVLAPLTLDVAAVFEP